MSNAQIHTKTKGKRSKAYRKKCAKLERKWQRRENSASGEKDLEMGAAESLTYTDVKGMGLEPCRAGRPDSPPVAAIVPPAAAGMQVACPEASVASPAPGGPAAVNLVVTDVGEPGAGENESEGTEEPSSISVAAERIKNESIYTQSRVDFCYEGNRTQYKFHTEADIDMSGLWAWVVFTAIWLCVPIIGSANGTLSTGLVWAWRIFGFPVIGPAWVLGICTGVFFGGVPPAFLTQSFISILIAFGCAVGIGRWRCRRERIPVLDYFCRVFILRIKKEKVSRIVHTYTLDFIEYPERIADETVSQYEVRRDHDTRPICNARGTMHYGNAQYSTWTYTQSYFHSRPRRREVRCSIEALLQVCANPRLMHLKGDDATIKEQIKATVATMDCVNIARNAPLTGESLSASTEAVAFAFWKHCQRRTEILPF
jgi:hypothetical protein